MEIQVALDRIPLERAVAITTDVARLADWIEVGTSLVKQFGETGLRAVAAAAADTPVLADLKTADDVAFEFAMAHDAGAAAVTVLGLAPQVSIDLAVQVSAELDMELVVDLMGLPAERVAELAASLPAEVRMAPHLSKDSQGTGQRVQDLLGPWATGRRLAMAGGLTAEDLPHLQDVPDLRVIVGSAVTAAEDPIAAVERLRSAAGKDRR